MSIKELVTINRSCRRFRQHEAIPLALLTSLVEVARLCPSAANRQPLKYIISNDSATNDRIFKRLGWASYLTSWSGPKDGERPAAYVVVLHDTGVADEVECDHGIACQSMLLAAVEQGLAGCIIASVAREKMAEDLDLLQQFRILLVLALGYPVEERVIEPMPPDGDIRYWRDQQGIHHVPKRSLAELIVARYGK